jgi:glycosyltransferase involved in cell wall biosynthesis
VYEPIDSYAAAQDLSPAESHRIVQSERVLIRRAMVISGALGLAERFRTAPGGSHWLPFCHDLTGRLDGKGVGAAIARPRLCVVGEFDWRVDEALLCQLAARHPEWQLVMAGPRRRAWGELLTGFANVHWLGRIPTSRVRPVIADCDITLIPYRLTDWTQTCLPVKVFEYLAEAKPVVATPLPELSLLKDVVSLVPADQFEAAIAQGMSQTGQKACDHRRRASTRFTLQARARAAARLLQGEPALAPTA